MSNSSNAASWNTMTGICGDALPLPRWGGLSCGDVIRWLAPPANFRDASGVEANAIAAQCFGDTKLRAVQLAVG